ncbi:DUF1127 domain-containing protein [Rhodoligotrophos defluvii]|uniref:DUF1127 domain-containing protein n=1 Tax=Rhodoligotrophos defluvii TaxID=2561934 RepID=UPI0010C98350|nr:DUF1127 domain-containing protein [Rhodoligotrophos defluvii]
MMQCEIERTAQPSNPVYARLAKTALTLFRNWSARRKVRSLVQLEDATLRDIGLTRGDVLWASSLPVRENPIRALSEVSKRRYR